VIDVGATPLVLPILVAGAFCSGCAVEPEVLDIGQGRYSLTAGGWNEAAVRCPARRDLTTAPPFHSLTGAQSRLPFLEAG
jgi:hypothetical protein